MFRKRYLLLAVVVVALAASVVFGYVVEGRSSQPAFTDNLVFIPMVVGQREQEAVAAVKAAGLRAEIRYERRLGRRSEGRVVGQQAPSARFTSRGNAIVLIVARGA